ncbi:hypothetical protein [Niveispirillum sp. BGYR6]|uniref:hypothetical protein n=1 Tax=Niveispirillum sp. BGYR6 TaxID=2971249 RepID=UPI0022B95A9E|nr:hypothetical protein [Niveispirillum sp. BGYR6]MDG5494284.1 hypothetical protein [Niveispirillum sp. BGYR6]
MIKMNGAYINGIDDKKTKDKTAENADGASTTDYILFSLTVPDASTGDIHYGLGKTVIASGGTANFNVNGLFFNIIDHGMKHGSCKRVWLSLGGAGTNTFTNIQKIFEKNDNTRNFLLGNLAAIAGIIEVVFSDLEFVGFDMDLEDGSLKDGMVPLIIELSKLKDYQFTFCPYSNESGWVDSLRGVYSGLNRQPVVGMNLQVYSGGAGNNPNTWTSYLKKNLSGTGLTESQAESFIWPIQSFDSEAQPVSTPDQMKHNLKNKWKSKGGSFWATQNLSQPGKTIYTWADYAGAITEGID